MHFFTRKTIAFLLLLFVFAGSFLVPQITVARGNPGPTTPKEITDFTTSWAQTSSASVEQRRQLALSSGKTQQEADALAKEAAGIYSNYATDYVNLHTAYDANGNRIDGKHADPRNYMSVSLYDRITGYSAEQLAQADKLEYERFLGFVKNDAAQLTALATYDARFLKGNETLAQQLGDQATKQAADAKANIDSSSALAKDDEPIICIKTTVAGLPSGLDPIGCAALASWALLKLSSYILALVAMLFNVCIDYTLNFKNFITKYDIVGLGWKSFRDLINLLFIFVLVYIGIGTIIGSGSFNKKMLPQIIMAAVFINFSLFFTQAIIDASNIVTLQFYNKIIESSKEAVAKQGGNSAGGSVDNYIAEKDSGMSAAIVNALGMNDIFTLGVRSTAGTGEDSRKGITLGGRSAAGLNAMTLLLYGVMGSVFTLVTAFVLGAAAFMFIFRAVTLIFLMVLSPAGFALGILPQTKKYADMWWDYLNKNILFAPVYMALMYLVLHMMLQGSYNNGSFLKMFDGNAGAADIAFVFIVLISLMTGCLFIAVQMGAYGAKSAQALGSKWASAARGYATGLAMKPVNFTARTGVVAAGAVAGGAGALLARNGGVIGARIGSRLMGLKDATRNVKIGGKSQEEIVKGQVASIKKRAEYIAKAHEASDSATPAEKAAAKARGEAAVGDFIAVGALGSKGQGLGMGLTTKREALKKVAEERKKKAEGKTKGAQDALEKLELYSDAEKSSASTDAEKFKQEMASLKTKLGKMEEAEAQGTAIDQNEYKFLMERLDNKRKEHKAVMEIVALQKKVEKEKKGLFDKEDEKKS